jgi:ketosteroid isomerase-like protein
MQLKQEEQFMSRTMMASSLIRCALVLTVFVLGATVCPSQGSDRAEIAEMLNKHDEALKQQNLDALMAMYSSSPKTVMLGTGPGERFQGKEEIRAAYTEIFKDFDKGTLTHACYWKDGGSGGNLAWVAAMCKFSDSKGDKKREYELNVSAVAGKQAGKWQFVMIHYSNLVGSGGTSQ